jgi:hypothetical protein
MRSRLDRERRAHDEVRNERDAAAVRAAEAEGRATEAEGRAGDAERRAAEAEGRAAEAEGRAVGVDADVLWALELLRSERTWRHSVAPGPDAPSVLDGTTDPLRQALQIELDAAREDVGVEVELDAELPEELSTAGALLALRTAQEMLAPAVRDGELTSLQIRPDGADLVITIHSLDENDEPVVLEPLAIPTSTDIEPIADGVRIRRCG